LNEPKLIKLHRKAYINSILQHCEILKNNNILILMFKSKLMHSLFPPIFWLQYATENYVVTINLKSHHHMPYEHPSMVVVVCLLVVEISLATCHAAHTHTTLQHVIPLELVKAM